MFVYLFTFTFDSLRLLWCKKTIIFQVKTLILHPFIKLEASGRYFRLVDIRHCYNVLFSINVKSIVFM